MAKEATFINHLSTFMSNRNSRELVLCMGPMFSGKTTLLYKTTQFINTFVKTKADHQNIHSIVINHSNDTRDNNAVISSHDPSINGAIPCVKTNSMFSPTILEFIYNHKTMIILVDEAQFFNRLYDFVEFCFKARQTMNKNIFIGCFGLNADFNRQPIGKLHEVIPYATDVIILSGKCSKCIRPSRCSFLTMPVKRNGNTSNIIIGGEDKYIPLCHSCYNEQL